jgi:CubicO group peptidase (beta-lactamase class C family)
MTSNSPPLLRPTLPSQPEDVPWPTREWPTGKLVPSADDESDAVCEALFGAEHSSTYGTTLALLMVQRGRIVLERYGGDAKPSDTLRSWSMAKSITHALAGILAGEGLLDLEALAPVDEWRAESDLRSGITLDHLLRMTDGLDFQEDWVPDLHCHCIDMLFQSGKDDTAAYARSRPAKHPPGVHWNYSSGTSNVIAAILGEIVGGGRDGMEKFISDRLFAPLGLRSATPRFDAAGTFIGSSFVYATAQDFARFGLLYLRDGIWEDRRLLPEGWVDHARSLTPQSAGEYGAHWWLDRDRPGTFSAVGFEGQYLHLNPERDVIVLRLGVSTPEQRLRVEEELTRLVSSAPPIT